MSSSAVFFKVSIFVAMIFTFDLRYFRYKLPIIIIIVNNNGIYGGFDAETYNMIRSSGDVSDL